MIWNFKWIKWPFNSLLLNFDFILHYSHRLKRFQDIPLDQSNVDDSTQTLKRRVSSVNSFLPRNWSKGTRYKIRQKQFNKNREWSESWRHIPNACGIQQQNPKYNASHHHHHLARLDSIKNKNNSHCRLLT